MFGHLIRSVLLVLTLFLLVPATAGAQTSHAKKAVRTTKTTRGKSTQQQATRTMESVKKDKNTTERKISETTTKLQTNTKELKRQLNRLNSLNADIETTRSKAEQIKTHLDSLGSAITVTADSIKVLENELETMRRAYVKAMRELQPHSGAVSDLSFIFSAETFSEAYSRIRYLRQFSSWRERKADHIRDAIDRIADRRSHLTQLRHSQDQAYRKAEETRQTLSRQQVESEQMVTRLRKEDSTLRRSLDEQKRKAAALDRELDRLIAAEQARIAREEEARRKAEEKRRNNVASAQSSGAQPSKSNDETTSDTQSASAKDVASANASVKSAAATDANSLSGSFAANKGRLLFPVSGKYKVVRRFGRQPHPTLKHVETDNSGIDIEVASGSDARAVFAGTVSAILRQDGFNNIVMLRHGHYITIYAGLEGINVKKGDTVKAGQSLGRIFSDPEDSNRTILHFEIRNERQKLNPSLWVR